MRGVSALWLRRVAWMSTACGWAVVVASPLVLPETALAAGSLPVPCAAGACGAHGPSTWLGSGSATFVQQGPSLTVNQTSPQVLLNWSSFDIGSGNRVSFTQPGPSSIALNQIYQAAPSQIFGSLSANGQVYLLNPNGFLFGRTATVNVAGLVASSLNLSDGALQSGILNPALLANGLPAFLSDGRSSVIDLSGKPVLGPDGKPLPVQLLLEPGAQITTSGVGGRVLLVSNTVTNGGTILTPDGQAILAAGQKLYVQASGDPLLRGLLVEVDSGGTVTNQAAGLVSADRGNVTLLGLAVNQSGRVSATTSVAANGSVRLLARDTVSLAVSGSDLFFQARHGGAVTLGASSRTTVTPELDDPTTALDEQAQPVSSAEITGRQVTLEGGAQLVVPGGTVSLTTFEDPATLPGTVDPQAQIRVGSGAVIDVAGSSASVPMSRNLVTTELRATEFADDPLQRNGALRGQTVVLDRRFGTPIANVSTALNSVERTVAERLSAGGSIDISSSGDLVLAAGSRVDVSGGAVTYEGGVVQTTQLVTASGTMVDISKADPNQVYVGLRNPTLSTAYSPWGVTLVTPTPGAGHYEPSYVQGSSAGGISLAAPTMIVDATLVGNAVSGPYQRTPATAPAGGSLVIGIANGQGLGIPNYDAPSIDFSAGPSNTVVTPGTPLPAPQAMLLPVDFLTTGGFTSLHIYSNGAVRLPAGLPLSLAPGDDIEIGARTVRIGSDITTAGGTIALTALPAAPLDANSVQAGIFIAPATRLDVRGEWVNDLTLPIGTRPMDVLETAGGSIALKVGVRGGALSLGDDDALLASGGGSVSATGAMKGGVGGSIMLAADSNGPVSVGSGLDLEAFGVLGARGGSFLLDAGRIAVAPGATPIAAQSLEPPVAGVGAAAFTVGAGLFDAAGFSTVTLRAEGAPLPGGQTASLEVLPGTVVDAVTRTLQPVSGAGREPSAANVAGFSEPALLPTIQQTPMTVNLQVGLAGADPKTLAAGTIAVDSGAQLEGGPQASFKFNGVGGIVVDGAIRAPDGNVTFAVPNRTPDNDLPYSPALRIVLGPQATVDVSGERLLNPRQDALLTGAVLGGGTVTFNASRGGIEIDQGSVIDVSGGSGYLDLLSKGSAGQSVYARTLVGGAGGTLALTAPEFIDLLGEVHAAAGASGGVAAPGGTLAVTLSRNAGFSVGGDLSGSYPSNPRELDLVTAPAPPVIGQNGQAIVSADAITGSGFDAVTLAADRVAVDAGVSLALARSLTLDAPAVSVRGAGVAALEAPVLSVQNTLVRSSQALASTGAGTLELEGDYVQFNGQVVMQGIGVAKVSADSDLVFQGFYTGGASVGSLTVAGDVSFAAPRAYPSALAQFTITAAGGTSNDVTFTQRGTSTGVPLSVGGALIVNADSIEQHGTLLAPFGRIQLAGNDGVTLGDGSLTSVSGAGAVVPFGLVQNSNTWVYGAVNPVTQTGAPAKRIDLASSTVTIAAGATVDLGGGGDLYAYDWVPGTGGTTDALSASVNPTLFAVLPSLRNGFAPYDPAWYAGTSATPGQSVYLSGVPGLAAGVYPVLPARYALLPGAFLVEPVSGFSDLAPGTAAALPGGTPVVSGYSTFANTGLGATRTSGYAVYPGSYAHQLAEYDNFLASGFFPTQAAQQGRVAAVPADAGTLSLLARNAVALAGSIDVAPAASGRGAEIDLSVPSLTVSGDPSATGPTTISDAVLAGWAPQRLVLGGVSSADGSSIAVGTDSVTFTGGAALTTIADLEVVASQLIEVDAGSTLRSPSSAASSAPTLAALPTVVSLGGGAAYLALSDIAVPLPARPSATATAGQIVVAPGAELATRGALTVDAGGGVTLGGTINAPGASIDFGSGRLILGGGAPSGVADGTLTLTPATLAQVDSAAALQLTASKAIEFGGAVTLGVDPTTQQPTFKSLTINAPLLYDSGAGPVVLGANVVTLTGPASAGTITPGTAGGGTLSVEAGSVTIGPGAVSVAGFGHAALTATGTVNTAGRGALIVDSDLDLASPALTPGAGAETLIDVGTHALSFGSLGPAPPPAPSAQNLGARLTLAGGNLSIGSAIVAPSSDIELQASQSVVATATAQIDVSGVAVTAGGRTTDSPGGTIGMTSGGTVSLAAGSVLRADGPSGANAGGIRIASSGDAALGGLLSASSTAGGGAFDLSAHGVGDFQALLATLASGGFAERIGVHVATGDLGVPAGTQVASRTVDWSTDGGRIDINGAIDASHGATRGSVRLYAQSGLGIGSGASISVDAPAGSGAAGTIELGTSAGAVDVAPGAVLSGRGAAPGTLLVRAPAVGDDVAVTELGARFQGFDSILIEPVLRTVAPAKAADDALAGALDAAVSYGTAAAPVISARLGSASGPALVVSPGVELVRNGDLEIATGADLTNWHVNGAPVNVTLRATGSLTVDGVLSDGFVPGEIGNLDLLAGASARLQLVAGANLASADPLATNATAAADLVLTSGAILRTGTGGIALAAARDVSVQAGSSVYTAGLPGLPTEIQESGVPRSYPVGGGAVTIVAGRDVLAVPTSASITAFLPHSGSGAAASSFLPTQWGIALDNFAWSVGSLGGGDVTVSAGRDIRSLSVAVADSATQSGPGAPITPLGAGGNLAVSAGGDIDSLLAYEASGAARIAANGGLLSNRKTPSGQPLGSLLLLGSGTMSVVGRTDVALEGVMNPFVLGETEVSQPTYFYTYGSTASLQATSVSGTLSFSQNSTAVNSFLGADASRQALLLGTSVAPPSLSLRTLAGDIRLASGTRLYPADRGQLDLFAARDLVAASGTASVTMSDAAEGSLATPLQPAAFAGYGVTATLSSTSSARHVDDPLPVLVSAGRDIVGVRLQLPKPLELTAGRDLISDPVTTQQFNATDTTLISAGRDYRMLAADTNGGIVVGGPGRVLVETGRNLDLGFSEGLTTVGRNLNPNLPSASGADVELLVGMGANGPDIAGFVNKIVTPSETYRKALTDFMGSLTGNTGLSYDEALVEFSALPRNEQLPFVLPTFFGSLLTSGRDANSKPGVGFSGGYAAIDALWPGSRDLASGAVSPYAGDLTLPFSRIYTLAGGSIDSVVPGGLVNVGLANPPQNVTVARAPGQLGIVTEGAGDVNLFADGNILVNQSRVFTLLGGNILIWSTTGNIDAGRGSKSAISAPPPVVTVDAQGNVVVNFAGAVAGSGIRTIQTDPTVTPGNVDLIAPSGFVNAGDAGIGAAGNLNIAAQRVLGLDNIQVGGTAVGVPPEVSGLGVALAAASSSSTSASSAATSAVGSGGESAATTAPLAQSALSWLDVFVVGLGEEGCKPEDLECLKRQKTPK